MSVTGITTQSSSLSLISGTAYSADTAQAGSLAAQGMGLDESSISKGAQQMNKLAKLASSDPDKFKEAAQKISDQLTEAAKNSSNSNDSQALSDMAAQWAEAAETGSMPTPPQAPSGGAPQGAQGQMMKFKGQQGGGPMGVADSVISSVLSGMNISAASSSSSGASAGSYYSVASSDETAA